MWECSVWFLLWVLKQMCVLYGLLSLHAWVCWNFFFFFLYLTWPWNFHLAYDRWALRTLRPGCQLCVTRLTFHMRFPRVQVVLRCAGRGGGGCGSHLQICLTFSLQGWLFGVIAASKTHIGCRWICICVRKSLFSVNQDWFKLELQSDRCTAMFLFPSGCSLGPLSNTSVLASQTRKSKWAFCKDVSVLSFVPWSLALRPRLAGD